MRTTTADAQVVAFDGDRLIATGELSTLLPLLKQATVLSATGSLLVFDATTSQRIEVELRDRGDGAVELSRAPTGEEEATVAKRATLGAVSSASPPTEALDAPRTRSPGRPRLGVVAREVTLLPRHWDWLATQPGGASAALRRLVDQARSGNVDRDRTRRAQEYAYRFMSATLGDHPGFEEASRALFAGDRGRFTEHSEPWPTDLRAHARYLADAAFPT